MGLNLLRATLLSHFASPALKNVASSKTLCILYERQLLQVLKHNINFLNLLCGVEDQSRMFRDSSQDRNSIFP